VSDLDSSSALKFVCVCVCVYVCMFFCADLDWGGLGSLGGMIMNMFGFGGKKGEGKGEL
jgi:hypothetical protein